MRRTLPEPAGAGRSWEAVAPASRSSGAIGWPAGGDQTAGRRLLRSRMEAPRRWGAGSGAAACRVEMGVRFLTDRNAVPDEAGEWPAVDGR